MFSFLFQRGIPFLRTSLLTILEYFQMNFNPPTFTSCILYYPACSLSCYRAHTVYWDPRIALSCRVDGRAHFEYRGHLPSVGYKWFELGKGSNREVSTSIFDVPSRLSLPPFPKQVVSSYPIFFHSSGECNHIYSSAWYSADWASFVQSTL